MEEKRKRKKSFTVPIRIPKSLERGHIWRIRKVFSELCDKAISNSHRTSVHTKNNTAGHWYCFQVKWGFPMEEEDAAWEVVKALAKATIYYVETEHTSKTIEESLEKAHKLYDEKCKLKDVFHIHVEPQKHIKLC